MEKPESHAKPWNTSSGALIGMAVGLALWLSSHEPGTGLLQNWKLIVGPAVFGIVIVSFRNMRKKVGAWDPQNRDPQP